MIIQLETPDQPEPTAMLARLDACCATLYPVLGTGRRLLDAIAARAAAADLSMLRLETGIHQPEALALYRRYGFTECAPFGHYVSDPLSVFMEKRL
jgi:hypothetical protein